MVDVSIIIPAYNVENYIRECIDSILDQKTKYSYEILVCDDGSTDNTYEILKSYYKEGKIKLFHCNHHGIVRALNLLLHAAESYYIMRMDADDKMLPNRIQFQLDYMEAHTNIDLLGGGRIYMKSQAHEGNNGYLNFNHFKNGNVVIHPTIVFKSSLNVQYKDTYPLAEDMYLYYELLCNKKVIYLDPTPVIEYREPELIDQKRMITMYNSGMKIAELFKKKNDVQSNEKYPLNVKLNNKSKELTCIITSRNEGNEVRKTIESIRKTAPLVPIILINDASDDGYDYDSLSKDFSNVKVHHNKTSLGVAKSRDIGVELTKTEYFVLLDGHMRFYNDYWETLLIKALIEHPRSIVTANTIIMKRDENGVIKNEDGSDYNVKLATGAIVNEDEPFYELTSKWAPYRRGECLEVTSIMGAVYASTVYWWRYIKGLEGLKNYGNDESFMSIKTWLLGGKCYVLNNWGVGHLYRDKHPYTVHHYLYQYNKLLMVELFIKDNELKKKIYGTYKEKLSPNEYGLLINELRKEKDWIQELKEYINERQIISLDQYLAINREYAKK